MAIWSLYSIDDNSPNWRASTYKGDLLIRAETESKARQIAAMEYGIAPEKIPGGATIFAPWNCGQTVACKQIHDSDYDENGQEEILKS